MNEGTRNYASSQVHICQVLKLMGCDEHENSVRTLLSIEIRRQVEWASDREIENASMRMCYGKASRHGHMCCYPI